MSISNARIHFNQQGTPVAGEFDDVYFSNASGLEECRYVFIQNNHLAERWTTWQQPEFVIAETGFGTGLNFIATVEAFLTFRAQQPSSPLKQLYFISTEKFPLNDRDLSLALSNWPQLQTYSDALIEAYPAPVAGCHRRLFAAGQIVLDLWLGDIHDSLPQMNRPIEGLVNAWFLDGFAPSKNPQMWTETLFSQMAALSAANCTFATFTAAGMVKRGLQQAGFRVQKREGFGHKRDMLAGQLEKPPSQRQTQSVFYRHALPQKSARGSIAIVGGGLAAANCALSLVERGFEVDLYFQDKEPAQGASGSPQGGFYPQLNAEASINSQIQALAFLFAKHRYQNLLDKGHSFAHQWCGVLQLAFNQQVAVRQKKLINNQTWPEGLIHGVDAAQASKIANLALPYPALFIPQGGWLSPPQLVNCLITAAQAQGHCRLHPGHCLQKVEYLDKHWQLTWQVQSISQATNLILANAADCTHLLQCQALPLRQVRGQVEAIPTQAPLTDLRTVLCHKGYLTPALHGRHALGSTYIKNDRDSRYRVQERDMNLRILAKALKDCAWAEQLQGDHQGRAGIRCSAPDHLPLTGAAPDIECQKQLFRDLYKSLPEQDYPMPADHPGLFMLTGLGSRGLTTAPLMAEVLASQISGQPLPLAQKLLNGLNPNRFLVRSLIRRQPV